MWPAPRPRPFLGGPRGERACSLDTCRREKRKGWTHREERGVREPRNRAGAERVPRETPAGNRSTRTEFFIACFRLFGHSFVEEAINGGWCPFVFFTPGPIPVVARVVRSRRRASRARLRVFGWEFYASLSLPPAMSMSMSISCLLYTSDAADE